jgi:hypothetical protein
VSLAIRRRHRAAEITETARTVRQRAPVTLTLVRQRAQPTAASIARLTVTAVFAYLLALLIPSTPHPVLAPLTALLVVQVSAYQTLRSAVRRVASVVAGVMLAFGLSAWVGFTWWSLGIAVAVGLAVGHALHLREDVLEVPISAMLILSVGTRSAATGRILETAIGTAAGLVAGFVLTSPRLQPAEEAVEELCRTMAGLLEQIAAGLGSGSDRDSARGWLAQARSLGNEIRRVDDALRAAEESTKLNLRSLRLPYSTMTLRESLETLEHEAVTLRLFARSLVDSTRLDGDDNPLSDPDLRRHMAGVLRELAAAVRTYGSLVTEFDEHSHDLLKSELERHLAAAHDEQNRLSGLPGRDPATRPAAWPLRGELISQLDRLRAELEAGKPYRRVRRPRNRGWRLPHPGRQRLLDSWRRIMK